MKPRSIGRLMTREDRHYLERMLTQVNPREREAVKAEYKRRFLDGMEGEPVEHKRANAGRRAANLYLLGLDNFRPLQETGN